MFVLKIFSSPCSWDLPCGHDQSNSLQMAMPSSSFLSGEWISKDIGYQKVMWRSILVGKCWDYSISLINPYFASAREMHQNNVLAIAEVGFGVPWQFPSLKYNLNVRDCWNFHFDWDIIFSSKSMETVTGVDSLLLTDGSDASPTVTRTGILVRVIGGVSKRHSQLRLCYWSRIVD